MDRYKKLFSNTLIFAAGTFGSKLLTFLMTRFYQGRLTNAEYGISENIAVTANFLIPIFTLCIVEAVMRFGLDNGYEKARVFTNGIITTLSGMTVLALLFPLVNLIRFFDGYAFVLFAYVYTSSIKTLCSQFVRARGLVKLYAFDGILTTLAMVLFNILLLGVFRFGVYGFILSTVLSDAFSIVFLSIAANLPKYLRPELFDRPLLRSMLKYSAPLIPTTILWLVISMSDRFFITAMLGVEQNSYYVAANKIPLIVSTVSAFFTQAWHMSAITENSAKDYEKFFGKVFSAYQSLMYIATAGMILFIKPVMLVMFDPKYESSYKYISALLLGIMFMCLGSYLSSVYAVTKRSLNSLATSFAAAAANIILNFVLIPKMGIQGAAIATLASYALCFFIRVFDTRRYVKFKVNYLKIFINCILLGGITYLAAIRPKLMYLWISLIFAVILVLNFSAIIKTVKKLLPNFKKA